MTQAVMIDPKLIVFQAWMFVLPMQQQSVLLLAARGPDGIGKFHATKDVVRFYRAAVLKAAYRGRSLAIDEEEGTTFMTLENFSDDAWWRSITEAYFDHVDELPHHYHLHLMHGAEIIGYKHPMEIFRRRWLSFYLQACHDMHLHAESEEELDGRLNDWDQQYWNEPRQKKGTVSVL